MEGSKSLKERISFKSKRIREMLSIKKKSFKDKVPQAEGSQPEIEKDSAPVDAPATQEPYKETGHDADALPQQGSEEGAEESTANDEGSEIAPGTSAEQRGSVEIDADASNAPSPPPLRPPPSPPVTVQRPCQSSVPGKSGTQAAAACAVKQPGEGAPSKAAIVPVKNQLQTPKCRDCIRGITGGFDAMFYNMCGARHQKDRLPVSTGIITRSPNQS